MNIYAQYDDGADVIVGDGEVEFRYPLDPEAVSMLLAALAEAGVLTREGGEDYWMSRYLVGEKHIRYVSVWKEAK
jgi:hypothetical protein